VLTHPVLLYRSTNRASTTTLVHRRPLIPREPTLDHLRTIFTDCLLGARYYTTLNLKDAYYRMRIKAGDK
jgi:hypothetical protein